MTKKEIINELRDIAEKIKNDNAPIASILYAICGSAILDDEVSLALFVNKYCETLKNVLNSNIKAVNAINN